jgi:hypothetical protein
MLYLGSMDPAILTVTTPTLSLDGGQNVLARRANRRLPKDRCQDLRIRSPQRFRLYAECQESGRENHNEGHSNQDATRSHTSNENKMSDGHWKRTQVAVQASKPLEMGTRGGWPFAPSPG